jgi:hypothetical protein
MKSMISKNCLFSLLILLHFGIISQASAQDRLEGSSRGFKERIKSQFKRIFHKKEPASAMAIAEPISLVSSLHSNLTSNSTIRSADSLVFEGPSSSLVPQRVTVSELFAEISINHDDFEGWKAVGQGLGQLPGWARSKHRQEKLIEIFRGDYEINVTLVNEKLIVLNEKSRGFFDEKDLENFPFDGTWAGSKYIFYPHTVVDTDEISDDDQPITFYLLKKISTLPQSLNFSKGQESLHMGEDFYHTAVMERAKGNIPEAISWFERSATEGNPRANLLIAQFYLDGNGVEKDEENGMAYLHLAATQGSSEAQYQLGLLNYYTYPSTEESRSQAADWLFKANEQGHLKARLYMAGLYELGRGIPQSFELAKKLYEHVATASADGSVLELRAHIRLNELDDSDDFSYDSNKQLELHKLALGGMPSAMAAIAGQTFDGHFILPTGVINKFLRNAAAAGNHEAIIIMKRTGITF